MSEYEGITYGNNFADQVKRTVKEMTEDNYVGDVRKLKADIGNIKVDLYLDFNTPFESMRMKNDIAYKYSQIEEIMLKHPEYFI